MSYNCLKKKRGHPCVSVDFGISRNEKKSPIVLSVKSKGTLLCVLARMCKLSA